MARTETWQLACLILTAMFIDDINGQCEISNVFISDYGNRIRFSWTCAQPNNEFLVSYQLINAGQCKAGEGSGSESPPFDIKTVDWMTSLGISEYKIYNGIYINSTYQFTVQSREWQDDRFVHGSPTSANITTDNELYVDDTKRTSDSLSLSWNPYPDQCVSNNNTEYEYQLIRSTDGHIAKSNVTKGTDITLSGLECDTDYRFRVTYKRDTGTGPDSFITIKTQVQTPPTPIVRLNSSSQNSISFTWDEYIYCSTRDYIQVFYDYELQRRATVYELLQSGREENSLISFNNLDKDTDYRFRVRVSTVSSTGGSRLSGWSSFASESTTILKPSTTSSAFSTTPVKLVKPLTTSTTFSTTSGKLVTLSTISSTFSTPRVKHPPHTPTMSLGNIENGSEGKSDPIIGLVAVIALGGVVLCIIVFIAHAVYIRSRLRKMKQRLVDTNRPNMAAAGHVIPLVGIDNPALNRTEAVSQRRVEETDYEYTSVGGPDITNQSGYEGINLAEVEREHEYQGLSPNP